ncbi:MAG: bifunctional nuclease family protein [Chloroflexi bacterium]|nr:bifunctional nuclease family protein [Chloroflexota bacterium]MBI4504611.1 bifunctional nuclease family protein [Chloroflexota bacterium]
MPVEVVVEAVRQGPGRQRPVVVLRQRHSSRTVALEVTQHEADALAMALQRVRAARPLTHDLLATMLARLGARVLDARIEWHAGQHRGLLRLDCAGEERRIACRPSDALTVALKVRAPLLCADDVFAESIQPGDAGLAPDEQARLAPFREFINSLDLEGFGTR